MAGGGSLPCRGCGESAAVACGDRLFCRLVIPRVFFGGWPFFLRVWCKKSAWGGSEGTRRWRCWPVSVET